MNIKLIICSGIVTAIIGGVFGLATVEISRGDLRQPKYESEFYQNLHDKYPLIIGTGLGFIIGMGQETVRELEKNKNREILEDLFDLSNKRIN
jgi:hypothetical protein